MRKQWQIASSRNTIYMHFIIVHLLRFRFDNKDLMTIDSKIMYFRLAFSKGNTKQSLKTRTEETAGVLQTGTKMTKMANKCLI